MGTDWPLIEASVWFVVRVGCLHVGRRTVHVAPRPQGHLKPSKIHRHQNDNFLVRSRTCSGCSSRSSCRGGGLDTFFQVQGMPFLGPTGSPRSWSRLCRFQNLTMCTQWYGSCRHRILFPGTASSFLENSVFWKTFSQTTKGPVGVLNSSCWMRARSTKFCWMVVRQGRLVFTGFSGLLLVRLSQHSSGWIHLVLNFDQGLNECGAGGSVPVSVQTVD